ILNGMSNDNTYKLAWGRAIIECSMLKEGYFEENNYVISFDLISYKMLRYYWNQTFFFQLKQNANAQKPPIVYQLTCRLIKTYTDQYSNVPIWFDKAVPFLDKDLLFQTVKRISDTLKLDVSWRFMKVDNINYDVYILDKRKKHIIVSKSDLDVLVEHGEMLIQLFNYKWAQLLEKYNTSPRIVSKVKGLSDSKIKRNNLNKFRDILLELHGDELRDFYTDEVIDRDQISIDHFIPWTYMYSDDLWNLVITSKSTNSSKSNRPPKESYIQKLEDRNIDFVERIQDPNLKLELIASLEHHYITTYYLGLIS
ncbi:MAG: HNH endonuclease domain-containing protein, partial [Acholeplasma sp.]|nr:HNH endonuclease domain-containing protein [Acholeplasma sp.]